MSSSEGDYCVYIHSVDGEAFYVGSGSKHRAYMKHKSHRNKLWAEFVESHGGSFSVSIHCWTNDRGDAARIETSLIAELSPKCNISKRGTVGAPTIHKGGFIKARKAAGIVRKSIDFDAESLAGLAYIKAELGIPSDTAAIKLAIYEAAKEFISEQNSD